jgi:hypothetical protein
MSRIRTVKPEYWSSEQVMECSPIARLLFIGLWNFCDDAGRHPLAPKQIKALIFPGDDMTAEDVSRLIDELSTNGLIQTYSVDGKDYLQVTGWQHQKIDRPQTPKYPGMPIDHSSSVRDGREGKGEDRKGKEEERGGADAPTGFAFVGKVVRLTVEDFGRWAAAYDAVPDLMAELTKADAYYSENPPADGKWFFPVSKWLDRAHADALKAKVDPDEKIYRGVH